MSLPRPARLVVWLIGLALAGLAVVALAVYWILPRTGYAPAPHDWTAEWRSDPPVVSTLPGGLLETATIRMGEDFYKSDALTWWGLYLGNTVSHIQVAAVYRYGVPLADPTWAIVTRGQTTVVVAPSLAPSLPVAVDTGTWREKTENGVPVAVSVDGGNTLEGTVEQVAAGEIGTTTITLTPTPEGEATIEVKAGPVPGENITENNEATYVVVFE